MTQKAKVCIHFTLRNFCQFVQLSAVVQNVLNGKKRLNIMSEGSGGDVVLCYVGWNALSSHRNQGRTSGVCKLATCCQSMLMIGAATAR